MAEIKGVDGPAVTAWFEEHVPGAKGPFELMRAYEQDPWGQSWERRVTVPYWSLAIPLAVLPVFVPLGRRYGRRAHRRRNGLCLRCGYDLRATPGACPECGAIP